MTEKNGFSPWTIALIVSIATFMEVLDTTITNVSLSHIAGTLSASQNESTWVLTSYLVANGIVLPISGWLSNVIGRKRYFMLCIAGFTAASFACGAANSMTMLVIFRVLQGLAGGGLQPTQQAIILDAFPPAKRGSVFAITGITLIAAPIIGPTLGGLITDNFSWRWIFYINVPVGIIALMLVGMAVHADQPNTNKKLSIDYIGLSLIALGLGSMQIVLDKGEQNDWFESNFILFSAIFSAACLMSAVFWLIRQKDPIVDLRLVAERSFGLSCVLIFFTGFSLYAGSALLPLLVQSQYGYDATLAGMILSPGGFAVIFLMPVAGKLTGYVQSRYLIFIGLLLTAFGMWTTSHITPQTDYPHFVMMRILQVLGLPFLFVPISTMAFMHIPAAKNNKASALYALSRNLGGSIGIAIISTYVVRHGQIHQNFLAAHLTPENSVYQNMLARYTAYFTVHGYNAMDAASLAIGKIYATLQQQATILSYNDGFLLLAGLIGIMAMVTAFLPANNPKTGGAAASAAH